MSDLLFQSKQERLPDGSPVIITRILGAIDGTTVHKFEEKLIGFFNQGVKHLILDFTNIKYINSTGMGLLVKLADKFQEGGGDIKIVGIPEKVIALFDMLGLLSLFKIYETEQDAINAIFSSEQPSTSSSASQPPPPPMASAPPPPPPKSAPPPPAQAIYDDPFGQPGGGLAIAFDPMEPDKKEAKKSTGKPKTKSEKTKARKKKQQKKKDTPRPKPAKPVVVEPEPDTSAGGKPDISGDDGGGGIAISGYDSSSFRGGMALSGDPKPDKSPAEKSVHDLANEAALNFGSNFKSPKTEPDLADAEDKSDLSQSIRLQHDRKPDTSEELTTPIIGMTLSSPIKAQKEIVEPTSGLIEKEADVEGKIKLEGFIEAERQLLLEQELPEFEKWLSDEAGNPKALEKIISKSRTVMLVLQKTVGVSCVVVINLVDNLSDLVTGYINGIYQSWKTYKTIEKRMKLNDPKKQADSIISDLQVAREKLSRFFSFPGYQNKNFEVIPTFALELVLDIRAHLDQMKRDLGVINAKEAKKTATKTVIGFIKSFIPNPLELFPIFKDFFIIAFIMKYSRSEIEQMYTDLIISYENILTILAKNNHFSIDINWQLYEKEIYSMSTNNYHAKNKEDLDSCISECRHKVQRLLQMLCKTKRYLEPKYWSLHDLFIQVEKEQRYFVGQTIFSIELEKRLYKKIEKTAKKRSLTPEEKKLIQEENKNKEEFYKIQKQFYDQFL